MLQVQGPQAVLPYHRVVTAGMHALLDLVHTYFAENAPEASGSGIVLLHMLHLTSAALNAA